jgi:hypothetical protein
MSRQLCQSMYQRGLAISADVFMGSVPQDEANTMTDCERDREAHHVLTADVSRRRPTTIGYRCETTKTWAHAGPSWVQSDVTCNKHRIQLRLLRYDAYDGVDGSMCCFSSGTVRGCISRSDSADCRPERQSSQDSGTRGPLQVSYADSNQQTWAHEIRESVTLFVCRPGRIREHSYQGQETRGHPQAVSPRHFHNVAAFEPRPSS